MELFLLVAGGLAVALMVLAVLALSALFLRVPTLMAEDMAALEHPAGSRRRSRASRDKRASA